MMVHKNKRTSYILLLILGLAMCLQFFLTVWFFVKNYREKQLDSVAQLLWLLGFETCLQFFLTLWFFVKDCREVEEEKPSLLGKDEEVVHSHNNKRVWVVVFGLETCLLLLFTIWLFFKNRQEQLVHDCVMHLDGDLKTCKEAYETDGWWWMDIRKVSM